MKVLYDKLHLFHYIHVYLLLYIIFSILSVKIIIFHPLNQIHGHKINDE